MGLNLFAQYGIQAAGSEVTFDPTLNIISFTDEQVVFTLTNNDLSAANVYYELDNANPTENFILLNSNETSSELTISGLNETTTYVLYAYAQAAGKDPSESVSDSFTTPEILFASATGGTTFEYNLDGKRYRSHTYTTSGTFELTAIGNGSRNKIDYLVVAGGGSGGGGNGGGGGAGGTILSFLEPTSLITETVTVGAGGVGVAGFSARGQNGTNSSFGSIIATGGGGGGVVSNNGTLRNGANGGSGGGAGFWQAGGGPPNWRPGGGGAGIAGQGFNGSGMTYHQFSYFVSGTGTVWYVMQFDGGGGGAGEAALVPSGTPTTSGSGTSTRWSGYTPTIPNKGGNGISTPIRDGNDTYYGGGGGGAFEVANENTTSWITESTIQNYGGLGGGGRGGLYTVAAAQSAVANTGGGGGGKSSAGSLSGAGGSGIVVVRYEIAPN